jgi:undecaprenyl-diphosphatase
LEPVTTHRATAIWRRFIAENRLVLAALLVVVGGTWGFVALADKVTEGETQRFDNRIIQWCNRHPGPLWLQDAGRDLTALGGVTVLALVTLAVANFLLISRKRGAAVLVVAAIVGGLVISSVIKHYVSRDRPPQQFRQAYVYTKSFPSGHSMLSAVTYLTLGALLAQVTKGKWLKLYIISVAVILTGLVGVSRVYLRVHWPTDVLAGWTAGLVWAILCQLVARWLQRRGAVEPESGGGSE